MKRKIVIIFAAVAILCSAGVRAQTETKASNVSGGGHGMDEEALSRVPKNLQAIVDSGQSSGMVTLVARNGEIASINAVGWRVMDEEPLETTDVFWAASITKPFVAVAIMMLVDEGKLQLDDLVEEHIPEFRGQKVKTGKRSSKTAEHPLTIRNALNHLDGLPKNPVRNRATKSIKERVLKIAKDPLMWEPGTKWSYGGEGLYVAAYLVEKYSGMEFAEFLKTRMLDPLGMTNTYFTIKNVPEDRAVQKYTRGKNGKWTGTKLQDFTWSTGGHYFAVDGGFFSTVEDLFPWYQMLLNGGEFDGVRYLSKESVRELTRNQSSDVKSGHGAGNCYGLAFQVVVEPQGGTAALTRGSFGKGGAGGSITWVDPSTKTIYIMLQNISGGNKELGASTFLNTASAAIDTKASTSDPADINFAAMFAPVPPDAKFSDKDYFIWGASMVRDTNGTCHLFYSRWLRKLGFSAWVTHSEIAHAVSDSPLGPFKHVDVALPSRDDTYWDGSCTHNPTVHEFDGKYYLYYMGNTGDGKNTKGLNWIHRNNQRIGVAVADHPNGPWERFDKPLIDVGKDAEALDALMTSNPSILRRPDKTYVLVYKAVGKTLPLPFGGPVVHMTATSKSPTGPFVKHKDPVFTASGVKFPAEDPFIWVQDGKYFAILKDRDGTFTKAGRSLALFQSTDGIVWKPAKHALVTKNQITWQDEKTKPNRLERPQLWLENGKPKVLYVAVQTGKNKYSYNVHIPIRERKESL